MNAMDAVLYNYGHYSAEETLNFVTVTLVSLILKVIIQRKLSRKTKHLYHCYISPLKEYETLSRIFKKVRLLLNNLL